jgi:hypothetical protein
MLAARALGQRWLFHLSNLVRPSEVLLPITCLFTSLEYDISQAGFANDFLAIMALFDI